MFANRLPSIRTWVNQSPQNLLSQEVMEEILGETIDESEDEMPRKKSRTSYPRTQDYWNTPWGRMLRDPLSQVEGTRAFRTFRRRFRIPCKMFLEEFMPRVRAVNLFKTERESRIPVEIKCSGLTARPTFCTELRHGTAPGMPPVSTHITSVRACTPPSNYRRIGDCSSSKALCAHEPITTLGS